MNVVGSLMLKRFRKGRYNLVSRPYFKVLYLSILETQNWEQSQKTKTQVANRQRQTKWNVEERI